MANNSSNLSDFILRSSSTGQIVIYIFSFSKPGTPEASYFSGTDIIEFLYHFQHLGKKHGMNDDDLIKILPDYYEREKRNQIKTQEEFTGKN